MKRLFIILTFLIIIPILTFAGWETYVQLTAPADGDLISVQDISATGVGDGSGRISYLTLSNLATYIKTKVGDFTGIGTSGLIPDPVTDDGRLLNTGGWTSTVAVNIGGFPAESLIYADATGVQQPHPEVDKFELGFSSDGATENHQNAIDALQAANGMTDFTVSVSGESANAITATFAHPVNTNYLVEAWLSATDGGTVTTAFDGNAVSAWTLADATAHVTRTSNVAYQILTGADGDAAITFNHSDAASPLTKWACFECQGLVRCGEVAFSVQASPCALADYYDNFGIIDMGDAATATQFLAQKLKGSPTIKEVCKVTIPITKASGVSTHIHLEIWTVGTNNAGATRSGDSVQVGGDSDTVTVSTTAETVQEFLWTINTPPVLAAGTDVFMHWIYEDEVFLGTYWRGNYNELLYEGTDYDMWKTGADASKDGNFQIFLKDPS